MATAQVKHSSRIISQEAQHCGIKKLAAVGVARKRYRALAQSLRLGLIITSRKTAQALIGCRPTVPLDEQSEYNDHRAQALLERP